MKKYLIILWCLLCCSVAQGQGLRLMAGFDFPNATFYSHDLGESIGVSFGGWMAYYNDKEKDTPYYISVRSAYYALSASDDYGNQIKRTFLEMGAGVGFHIDRTIFFGITGGYLHNLTAKRDVQVSGYGTPVFGGELTVRLASFQKGTLHQGKQPSKWEIHIGFDLKRTVWDIEGLDRGPADRHTGSGMGSVIIRWVYHFK